MKKLLLILYLLCGALNLFADDYVPPFPLAKDPTPPINTGGGNNGGNEEDDDGHRAPARRVYCSIDFETGEVNITGYDGADIDTFEIWNEDRSMCLASTPDCSDFVAELADFNEPVFIIFYFEDFTLSGYFQH